MVLKPLSKFKNFDEALRETKIICTLCIYFVRYTMA